MFHSCFHAKGAGEYASQSDQSDHVLVWMTKVTKSGGMLSHQLVGVVKNFIAIMSALFRKNTAKDHKREHGLKLQVVIRFF